MATLDPCQSTHNGNADPYSQQIGEECGLSRLTGTTEVSDEQFFYLRPDLSSLTANIVNQSDAAQDSNQLISNVPMNIDGNQFLLDPAMSIFFQYGNGNSNVAVSTVASSPAANLDFAPSVLLTDVPEGINESCSTQSVISTVQNCAMDLMRPAKHNASIQFDNTLIGQGQVLVPLSQSSAGLDNLSNQQAISINSSLNELSYISSWCNVENACNKASLNFAQNTCLSMQDDALQFLQFTDSMILGQFPNSIFDIASFIGNLSQPTGSSSEIPASTLRAKIKKTSAPKIKRWQNAFMIFRKEYQDQVKRGQQEIGMSDKTKKVNMCDINKQAGYLWKQMSEVEKAPFYTAQEIAKEEHSRRYPGWKYQPRRNRKDHKSDPSSECSPSSIAGERSLTEADISDVFDEYMSYVSN